MAINVNTVYQTVLYILNKEQRGYITPQEFNSVATQIQLEIFENYFEDLNQLIRVPQADVDYADRIANIDEKIAIFKTYGNAVYDNSSTPGLSYFTIPSLDVYSTAANFYRLGSVVYNNPNGDSVELQRLSRQDFYNIEKSPLTKSTLSFPTYLYENSKLFVKPSSINSNIELNYVRKPNDVIWGFTVGSIGQYIYDSSTYNNNVSPPTGSRNFELHVSEQTNVILKILLYAGVIIKDPQVIQVAAQAAQANEVNSKS